MLGANVAISPESGLDRQKVSPRTRERIRAGGSTRYVHVVLSLGVNQSRLPSRAHPTKLTDAPHCLAPGRNPDPAQKSAMARWWAGSTGWMSAAMRKEQIWS